MNPGVMEKRPRVVGPLFSLWKEFESLARAKA
jgi:hypothetical protein